MSHSFPQDVKVVLGIGNPGDRYRNTRHNVGFRVVDNIGQAMRVTYWNVRWKGLIGETESYGSTVLLVKPVTYVNRSGDCAAMICREYSVAPESLLVVVDDVYLPLGKIRMRRKGSSGNHKGLTSIMEKLNTSDFPRLRIGIGKDSDGDLADYVLSDFSLEEETLVAEVVEISRHAVVTWIREGIDTVMNQYN